MIGNRAVDVLAGTAFGLRTALLAPAESEERAILEARGLVPTFSGTDLRDFTRSLLAA